MKEKVNIFCIYWVGEFRGRDFNINDVLRLHDSVLKHIDRPFDFYVLTNAEDEVKEVGLTPIPLIHDWPGWWAKVELHRQDLPKGRCLYLDLDSHVIRSLQPILDFPGDLVMFFTRNPISKWEKLRKQGWVCRYQAATMLFDSGTACMTYLYNKFCEAPEKYMSMYRSEQDVMGDWLPKQPIFPSKWMIKLDTIRNYKEPPDDVIIVTGQTRDGLYRKTDTIPWFEKMARG